MFLIMYICFYLLGCIKTEIGLLCAMRLISYHVFKTFLSICITGRAVVSLIVVES